MEVPKDIPCPKCGHQPEKDAEHSNTWHVITYVPYRDVHILECKLCQFVWEEQPVDFELPKFGFDTINLKDANDAPTQR